MDNIKIFYQSVFTTWPIEDNSIQSIVTSPPYWGLRKYDIPDIIIGNITCEHIFGDGIIKTKTEPSGRKLPAQDFTASSNFCIKCNAWKGQYGLEPSYKDYIEHTLLWCKEAFRVLKDNGIFFLNIGDSYQTQSGVNAGKNPEKYANLSMNAITNHIKQQDLPNKCRMLIPERIAIALIDGGFTLRNHIIWYKSNGMPESTKDRFSKKWESIFMFVKNEKYYFDLDAIREPHKQVSIDRLKRAVSNSNKYVNGSEGQSKQGLSQPRPNYKDRVGSMQSTEFENGDYLVGKLNPIGKNPGDVWSIPTQPSSEKHYAMWPEKLVERMLLCSTKANDIILDPFCGSGTTLKVAVKNNRIGYGVDLGYSDIQERKLKDIQKNII